MAFLKKLAVTITILAVFAAAQAAISLPESFLMFKGEEHKIGLIAPFSVKSEDIPPAGGAAWPFSGGARLTPQNQGRFQLKYSIFGLIPIKTATVSVIDRQSVTPGGFTVGISLHTDGLLVVALSDIPVEGGSRCPAKAAEILPGDIIVSYDGEKVQNTAHFASLVQNKGASEAKIITERGGKRRASRITPAFYGLSGEYKTGIWVRDGTMGIGTLSFYCRENSSWGALGHAISDIDTGTVLKVLNGKITKCTVIGVTRGERGAPGELRGVFEEVDAPLGTIAVNGNDGIYGRISENAADLPGAPVPVALRSQVREGAAVILSNIEGDAVREYSAVIQKVALQERSGSRGMIIKITDPELLAKTGGIVQGMSGSPILQDGHFVGAITHVFVNDPTRGYGIFAEWMLKTLWSIDPKSA